jgi:hypothetical protein
MIKAICSPTTTALPTPNLWTVVVRVTETFVSATHHLFLSQGLKIRAQSFHPLAHCGFHLTIMTEMFLFEVLLQWSDEVEFARHNFQDVWWMGKTFPVETACGIVL